MSSIALLIVGLAAFFTGYQFYSRYISRRIYQLDPDFKTPAHTFEDGVDFVPTNRHVLFGHHFTSVAGAAPIVGPAIAVIWGWLPAFLWVVLGTIFAGAVHDFGTLWVSTRHKAQSIGTLADSIVGGRAKILFLLIIFFLLLLVAGNETTRTVTTNGMIALIENPVQLALLEEDPSLVNSAVEEILRYAPAVHSFRRQAMEDTEIRGQKIRADDKLMLWYPSVNRDEEIFTDPDRFDVRRSPNDHLAFGIGEHYCLGATLARLELREIFRGIVTRFRDMEMAAPPRRLRSNFINGVKEMRVRFTPTARVSA